MRNRYLLATHTFALVLVAAAAAQSTTDEHFTAGVYGGYSLNMARAGFGVERGGRLNDAGECGRFESGNGWSPVFGLLADMPLGGHAGATAQGGAARNVGPRFRVGLNIQYSQRSSVLRYQCIDPAQARLPDGRTVPALTEHVAEISYPAIAARIGLAYQPFVLPLLVTAGPVVSAVPSGGTYDAREQILTPQAAEFLSGGQVMRYGGGNFGDGFSIAAGFGAGISYRAPIGRRLMLAPELSATVLLSDERSSARLRTHTAQATLALLYRFESTPEEPPHAPPVVAGTKSPDLEVTLSARAQRADGAPTDTLTIEQTGVVSSRLHPLLSYVFFDEGDSGLPARYIRRAPQQAAKFNEDALRSLGTLDIYYNLLDIIGLRMTRYPNATVTLTGTQPDAPAGADRLRLAEQRARNVRQYLLDVWNIAPSRIAVETRVEPASRSNPETREGAAENRRVEIASSTYEITEPLLLADTAAQSVAAPAWLAPRVSSDAGVDSWTIVVSGGRKHDAIFSGSGMPPAHLKLPQDFIDDAAATRPPFFGMNLTVRDNNGRQASDSVALPLRWIDNLSDIRFGSGSYSLILFDFNSATLRAEHQRTIDLVNMRGDTSTHAGVFGYTDMLGPDDLNRTLSAQRAASVSGRLKARIDQVEGRGETTLLYDNSLPEGRFYSRTVTIDTKTP